MIKFEDILLEKERDLTPLLLKTTNVKAFVNAVTNRNPISFSYYGPRTGKDSVKSGKRVKVEGVAFGVNKKGKMVLRAYVNPPSVSKKGFNGTHWRTYILSRMKNVVFHTEEQFNTKREDYKDGVDGSMTRIYATSDWGAKLKGKKIIKPKVEPTAEPKPEVNPEIEPTQPTSPETEPSVSPEPQVTTEPPTNQPTAEPTEPTPSIAEPTSEPTPPIEKKSASQPLPQPKPKQKPSIKPEQIPSTSTEVNPEENPEEDNDEALNESIKRIKRLMFL
jgi:hypothetical protein